MKHMYRLFSMICLLQFVTLVVKSQGTRDYRTNMAIAGQTQNSQGIDYLLLHKIYTGTLLEDNYVMGKISAIRGAVGAWNRKWTVEVNTASAYNTNRGSIICYNEPATLVTLVYNGESFLAVSIVNGSTLYNFSFTGYEKNQRFLLVHDENVSNVQSFSDLDPLTIQGSVGIGTTVPIERLEVVNVNTNVYTPTSTTSVVPQGIVQNIDNESGVDGTAALLRFTVKGTSGSHSIVYIGGVATAASNTDAAFVIGQRAGGGYKERIRIDPAGNVGIGTIDPKGYKLAVAGNMIAEKVKVKLQSAWPDFVFHPDYVLPPLAELERYIKDKGHLPEIPTAAEVAKEGQDLGEMNRKLLQKIEELTLYIIEQQKTIQALQSRDAELEARMQAMEQQQSVIPRASETMSHTRY